MGVPTAGQVDTTPAVVDGTVYVGGFEGPLYALNAAEGTERWRYDIRDYSFVPTVAGDTVYVPDSIGNIAALAAGDGSERWMAEVGEVDAKAVAVDDDAVYVGIDTSGNDNLIALDRTDGSRRWTFRAESDPLAECDRDTEFCFDAIRTTPTVHDVTVYVGTNDGWVVAVDATEGTERWRATTAESVLASLAVADGTVYAASTDGALYALATADGAQRWRTQLADGLNAEPAVAGDTVLVGDLEGGVTALSTADGSERWSFRTNGQVWTAPVVADGHIYVGTDEGVLYALVGRSTDADTPSGSVSGAPMAQYGAAGSGYTTDETGPSRTLGVQWRFNTGGRVGGVVAVVDGTIYVTSGDGALYAVTPTGRQRWRHRTDDPADATPAVADGTVYFGVGLNGTTLYAVGPDGSQRWSTEVDADGRPNGRVVVADETVYLTTEFSDFNAQLTAVDAASGEQQWQSTLAEQEATAPAVADGAVYLADTGTERTLRAIDAENGTTRWRREFEQGVTGQPTVVEGTVYVPTNSRLYALSTDSGRQRWRSDSGEMTLLSSPTVGDNTVYVGGSACHAFVKRDGSVRWTAGEGRFTAPTGAGGITYSPSRRSRFPRRSTRTIRRQSY